uniref:Uncharacterized protein n=1 Tax=viral metagenome TaxID=1070528 RepID=A0A6M3LEL5_9ZZZZ
MADKCISCGGWIVKEVSICETRRSYFSNGYYDFTYPIVNPTYQLKCIGCGCLYSEIKKGEINE